MTQAHGAEGPAVLCHCAPEQSCSAYTINHSGEINYSHPLGTNSQVEEEDEDLRCLWGVNYPALRSTSGIYKVVLSFAESFHHHGTFLD